MADVGVCPFVDVSSDNTAAGSQRRLTGFIGPSRVRRIDFAGLTDPD